MIKKSSIFLVHWSLIKNQIIYNKIYKSHFESVPTNKTCLWRFGLFVRFEVEIPNRFLSWIGLPMVKEYISRHILLTSYIRLILYVNCLYAFWIQSTLFQPIGCLDLFSRVKPFHFGLKAQKETYHKLVMKIIAFKKNY